jgi:hypothetical protein
LVLVFDVMQRIVRGEKAMHARPWPAPQFSYVVENTRQRRSKTTHRNVLLFNDVKRASRLHPMR